MAKVIQGAVIFSASKHSFSLRLHGLQRGNRKMHLKRIFNFLDQKIDVILSDYCMPEVTGYDLLKAVKENSCSRSMPVVMMSSENDSQRISRCLATGAADFLLKPLQVKDMQRLRNYACPTAPAPGQDTRRKLPVDLIAGSNGSEQCLHLAGVAVA